MNSEPEMDHHELNEVYRRKIARADKMADGEKCRTVLGRKLKTVSPEPCGLVIWFTCFLGT